MKYTNYILHGRPINPDSFIAEGYLKPVTVIVVLIPSFIGVVVLACLIPGAFFMDLLRIAKFRLYEYQRLQRRIRYTRYVIISLGHEPNRAILQQLMAA